MVSRTKTAKDKKKIGRPFADTQAVNLRLPMALLAQIDEWRAGLRPIPSRPGAIRMVLESFDWKDS
jgi:hypothetical protein